MSSIHDNISPTAWVIAYRRTFTDIPYANEIFEMLEKLRAENGQKEILDEFKTVTITPQIEARYKLVDKLIRKTSVNQVLELASGFTERGLDMTENPSVKYVELELPSLMKEKIDMTAKLMKMHGLKRDNLYLESGSALSMSDMWRAVSHFDPKKPIIVTHEGLLRYLSFEEKEIVAKNICELLGKFGGYWITPDISMRKIIISENDVAKEEFDKKIIELTKIDVNKNLFRDETHAREFFGKFGLEIEKHGFIEVIDELVSPVRLKLDENVVKELLRLPMVFVMTLRG